jgi:hypothetical protein
VYEGEFLTNIKDNKVLDVYQGRDAEHQKVITYRRHGKANQKWKIVYTDTTGKAATGMNDEFGFVIGKPFYLRSRLPFHRVAECQGASNVILKRWRNNQKQQQWYFDGVTKTIRSNYWKNYAMHIPGNGNQNELRMTSSINSRWW